MNVIKSIRSATWEKSMPLLLAALVTGIIPHLTRLPVWVIAWCAGFWLFALVSDIRRWPPPAALIRLVFALTAFAGVFVSTRATFGSDTGIALLCSMTGLKMLEIQSARDKIITLFIAYFMVISSLFFSSSLLMTLYMFTSVIVITSILIMINHPAGGLSKSFRLALVITLQALPFMIILFFIFPRIEGSLWGGATRRAHLSGFSDTLSPGSVSRLVLSKATAFRVSFKKRVPHRQSLYWRGIVFEQFDGKNWRINKTTPRAAKPVTGEEPVEYTVILEPHNENWLFALDLPGSVPRGTRLLENHVLTSRTPVTTKRMYSLTSHTRYATGPLKEWEKAFLQLPAQGNGKARKLAETWRRESTSPMEIVNRALTHFTTNDFYYTLTPPLSRNHPVDEFLFEERRGFCEHYASAFVFLMRAARIPARVVAGYMGGTVNPFGEYLIVKQSDAHAWAEVWIEPEGWVRADPTSAVAPERIEGGILQALTAEEVSTFFAPAGKGILDTVLNRFRLRWDALNHQWNTQIIGYSLKKQQRLMKKIGVPYKKTRGRLTLSLLAVAVIGASLFLSHCLMQRYGKRELDAAKALYGKFCRKLEKKAILRERSMGPADFAKRAARMRKDLKDEIHAITDTYIALRYGDRENDPETLHKLKQMVQKFKP